VSRCLTAVLHQHMHVPVHSSYMLQQNMFSVETENRHIFDLKPTTHLTCELQLHAINCLSSMQTVQSKSAATRLLKMSQYGILQTPSSWESAAKLANTPQNTLHGHHSAGRKQVSENVPSACKSLQKGMANRPGAYSL